eukprot:Rmarinus@m.1709
MTRRASTIASQYFEKPKEVAKRSLIDTTDTSSKPNVHNIRRAKRPRVEIKYDPPANWEQVYKLVEKMREKKDAPVDTMGTEALGEQKVCPEVRAFQHLVAVMLSSQTKDQVTAAATGRLKQHGLTPEGLASMSESEIAGLIYPVGFYKRKAHYLREAAIRVRDEFAGRVPDSLETLCTFKGVGPKMAIIALHAGYNIVSGVAVDVHVHRICARLGWTKKCKEPEHTRQQLEAWLPRDKWGDINLLLVGFGQTVCTPLYPSCSTCLVRELCPRIGVNKTRAK